MTEKQQIAQATAALAVLEGATSGLKATRPEHIRISAAIKTIGLFINAVTAPEPAADPDKPAAPAADGDDG